jgi:hypothetical protein
MLLGSKTVTRQKEQLDSYGNISGSVGENRRGWIENRLHRGSHDGMTRQQKETLRQILAEYIPTEVHHSDHVGADSDAHAIVGEACPTSRVIVHAPRDVSRRAYLEADAQRPARGRIARNREIVRKCDTLIAAPGPK